MRKTFIIILLGISAAFADSASTCVVNQPQSSGNYQSVHWYRDSAERNAIYREVFLLGELSIKQKLKASHLQAHQWGVVLDIDETTFDDSQMLYQRVMTCAPLKLVLNDYSQYEIHGDAIPTPGAVALTCSIQKMGGYVTLISNRDGTYTDALTGKNILARTLQNLNKTGVCYDQVILSHGFNFDKNARFEAVQTGKYDPNVMVYNKTLPAHQVVAYFGDNIQDFPNLYQQSMIKADPNGAAYDSFGITFFALPNPMYGSWQDNGF